MGGRTAIFIDGVTNHATARALEIDIDYGAILGFAQKRFGEVLRAHYFTTVEVDGDQEFIAVRPLLDYLEYNGWTVVQRPIRGEGRHDIGVALAVRAMEIAPHVDEIVIFSGRGDFVPLVDQLKRGGVLVTIISSIKSNPPACSEELRRSADTFIDLANIREAISRKVRDEIHS